MNKNVIKANQIIKKYGSFEALKGISLEINQGEIYGLVGNNGAGKTTFLKLLTGQLIPDSGQLKIFDYENERGFQKARERMGTIIETPSFYPKLSVEKNMEYYRIQRGIPGKDTIAKVLGEVGLLEARKKKFEALSLGMKQRLGLALALMNEPEVLLLDEPINGLDPSGIIEIRNLLLKLNREKNITILISSHILSELEHMATTYGFLNKGEFVEQITADKLKEKCQSYLEMNVTDPKKFTALLEAELQCTNYKVLPDFKVHIMDRVHNLQEYSSLAVNNGIGLLSMEMKEIDLENYYMNLITEK